MFPVGSQTIPNPEGTAPGIDLTRRPRSERQPSQATCRIFALPGVPAEMKLMWGDTVAPAIRAMFSSPRVIGYRRIKCFGVGESDLEQMLPDLIRRGREPQVGITVSGATITLRIAAAGETAAACQAAIEPTVATIRACLGELIFGEEEDELQHAVLRLLADAERPSPRPNGAPAASSRIGYRKPPTIFGASRGGPNAPHPAKPAYLGGLVLPTPELRRQLLDSAEQPLAADLPMESLVASLAIAARGRFAADYALAVGELPIADPDAAAPPRFHYAVAGPKGVQLSTSPYVGPADILKLRAAKQALDLLRLELLHSS